MHFREWKFDIFSKICDEICPLGSSWQYVNIGSCNSLMLSGSKLLQAFIFPWKQEQNCHYFEEIVKCIFVNDNFVS